MASVLIVSEERAGRRLGSHRVGKWLGTGAGADCAGEAWPAAPRALGNSVRRLFPDSLCLVPYPLPSASLHCVSVA